jgi:hypothetical protein
VRRARALLLVEVASAVSRLTARGAQGSSLRGGARWNHSEDPPHVGKFSRADAPPQDVGVVGPGRSTRSAHLSTLAWGAQGVTADQRGRSVSIRAAPHMHGWHPLGPYVDP